jgi:hypothetical protein
LVDWLKALIAWLLILLLAIAKGGLREAVLVPRLGLTGGLLVSGLLLCALVTPVVLLTPPVMAAWRGCRAA